MEPRLTVCELTLVLVCTYCCYEFFLQWYGNSLHYCFVKMFESSAAAFSVFVTDYINILDESEKVKTVLLSASIKLTLMM